MSLLEDDAVGAFQRGYVEIGVDAEKEVGAYNDAVDEEESVEEEVGGEGIYVDLLHAVHVSGGASVESSVVAFGGGYVVPL